MPRDRLTFKLLTASGPGWIRSYLVTPDGQRFEVARYNFMPRDVGHILERIRSGQLRLPADFPMREFLESGPPPTWACPDFHINPDTGQEFRNDGFREKCEICGRARPT